MSSTLERFQAAVNVIKGLPKNGSYQPSSAMMLTFYSYYKQATQGPCKQKKPNFWDIVGKAKWDAWMALGDMPSERAMELYVDELKKIIETMSYTENVANFMGSIDELDNVNLDDLETVAPEIMKKARSHPNSPFQSRGSSPNRLQTNDHNNYKNKNMLNGCVTTLNGEAGDSSNGINDNNINNNNYMHQNENSENTTTFDQSDDEYTDTVEDNIEVSSYKKPRSSHSNALNTNNRSESSYELQLQRDNKDLYLQPAINTSTTSTTALTTTTLNHQSTQVLQQIFTIVQKMNNDVKLVNQRISTLENHLIELKNMQTKKKIVQQNLWPVPLWWPIRGITPTWFIILILWPFMAKRLKRILIRIILKLYSFRD